MLKVKVKAAHQKKLAADAKRTGRKVDDLLAAILEDFFRGWRSDKRWMFYQQFTSKPELRKLAGKRHAHLLTA